MQTVCIIHARPGMGQHALANGNSHIQIREKMQEFSTYCHTILHKQLTTSHIYLDSHDSTTPFMYHPVYSTVGTTANLSLIHQVICREIKCLQQKVLWREVYDTIKRNS